MLLLFQETQQNGAYTYTLSTEKEGYTHYFTITATDGTHTATLPHFATIDAIATDFFHLIATYCVDPLHLADVWEDYTT